jgi:predicted SnoaL-like aldol condensation-catalyzing enzyme
MESPSANKAMIRSLYAAINAGDLDIIETLFAPDFVDHSTPEQDAGPEGVRQYFRELRAALPDLHVTIDDLLTEGEKVVVRTGWRGTTPGGNEHSRSLIQIFRIVDGAIREEWNEGGALL